MALACACQPAAHDDIPDPAACDEPAIAVDLPPELLESSGVAASRRYPGIFWTHNDAGWDPELFAVDSAGALVARVRVRGATNRDWEDIELASCVPGTDSLCLFIADTGDNDERHDTVFIYRVPEPDPRSDTVTRPATIIRAIYRDGPRDAEALFVNDHGIHIINKGRNHAIDLFRIPPPYVRPDPHVLRPRQRIAPPPTSISALVTAAAASQDGRRVVVRTYGGLRFFRLDADTLAELGQPIDLVVPDQRQGEAVDFFGSDRLVLTSEGTGPHPPHFAVVRCRPPGPVGPHASTSEDAPRP